MVICFSYQASWHNVLHGPQAGICYSMSQYSIIIAVVQSLSRVQLFATAWTAACQASPSFTISRSLLQLIPQFEATGASFPEDWNSKTKIAGQLREMAGPCPDHRFLIIGVRRPPWPHMYRKTPWRSKGSDAKLPTGLCGRIHLR